MQFQFVLGLFLASSLFTSPLVLAHFRPNPRPPSEGRAQAHEDRDAFRNGDIGSAIRTMVGIHNERAAALENKKKSERDLVNQTQIWSDALDTAEQLHGRDTQDFLNEVDGIKKKRNKTRREKLLLATVNAVIDYSEKFGRAKISADLEYAQLVKIIADHRNNLYSKVKEATRVGLEGKGIFDSGAFDKIWDGEAGRSLKVIASRNLNYLLLHGGNSAKFLATLDLYTQHEVPILTRVGSQTLPLERHIHDLFYDIDPNLVPRFGGQPLLELATVAAKYSDPILAQTILEQALSSWNPNYQGDQAWIWARILRMSQEENIPLPGEQGAEIDRRLNAAGAGGNLLSRLFFTSRVTRTPIDLLIMEYALSFLETPRFRETADRVDAFFAELAQNAASRIGRKSSPGQSSAIAAAAILTYAAGSQLQANLNNIFQSTHGPEVGPIRGGFPQNSEELGRKLSTLFLRTGVFRESESALADTLEHLQSFVGTEISVPLWDQNLTWADRPGTTTVQFRHALQGLRESFDSLAQDPHEGLHLY